LTLAMDPDVDPDPYRPTSARCPAADCHLRGFPRRMDALGRAAVGANTTANWEKPAMVFGRHAQEPLTVEPPWPTRLADDAAHRGRSRLDAYHFGVSFRMRDPSVQ
jgi:hypothetical protein